MGIIVLYIYISCSIIQNNIFRTTLRTCLGYVRNDIGRYCITNTHTQEVNQHKKGSPLFNIKNFLHLVGIKIDCKSSFWNSLYKVFVLCVKRCLFWNIIIISSTFRKTILHFFVFMWMQRKYLWDTIKKRTEKSQ